MPPPIDHPTTIPIRLPNRIARIPGPTEGYVLPDPTAYPAPAVFTTTPPLIAILTATPDTLLFECAHQPSQDFLYRYLKHSVDRGRLAGVRPHFTATPYPCLPRCYPLTPAFPAATPLPCPPHSRQDVYYRPALAGVELRPASDGQLGNMAPAVGLVLKFLELVMGYVPVRHGVFAAKEAEGDGIMWLQGRWMSWEMRREEAWPV
jgi:hypothetical protein